MNFYIPRIIIFALFLTLTIILIKKLKVVPNRRNKGIIIFSVFIVFLMNFMIPFEASFIKFNTVEASFRYSFPMETMHKKIEYENYAFIIFGRKNNPSSVTKVTKTGNKWNYIPQSTDGKIKHYKNGLITVSNIKSENVTLIWVSSFDTNPTVTVKDSIGSTILKEDRKLNRGQIVHEIYVVIENIPEGYYLQVNDEKLYLP